MSFLPPFELPRLPLSFGPAAVVSRTGTDGKPRVIRVFPRQGRRAKGEPITPPVVDFGPDGLRDECGEDAGI